MKTLDSFKKAKILKIFLESGFHGTHLYVQ